MDLDSKEESDLEIIKKRTVKGVAILTGRTFFLQVISFFSIFLLTIFLDPSQFGTFFLVSAVVSFFAYFADIGLAAALIQKKDKLSDLELKTTFTIQQSLVILLIILIFLLTPIIKSWYGLSQQSLFLLWALAFSLLLSSLKSIPSVLLERRLEFDKLIVPQIVETVVYYFLVVYLAWQGFGITSFTIAVLARGIVGLVLIYYFAPWIPGFAVASQSLRSLLKFGIPYQVNTFLAVLKDDGLTAILGLILGSSGIGFLGWAQKWGNSSLRFFMDPVIKVTFPAYARMQHNKKELSKAVSYSLFFVSFLVFPAILGLILIAPILVEIIPKYEKWQPALLALSLISVNAVFAAVTTPLTNLLNAIGKIYLTFRFMVMWTVLTWVLVPILSLRYGVSGAALGFAIVGISSIAAIIVALKSVEIDFWSSVVKPLLAAGIMGAAIFIVGLLLSNSVIKLLILILLGILTYGVVIFVLAEDEIKQATIQAFRMVRKND